MLTQFIKRAARSHAIQLLMAASFSFILLCPSLVTAADVAVVQSIDIKPYTNAYKGFKSSCNCRVEHYITSEIKEANIAEKVLKSGPDAIVTIGIDSLEKMKFIQDIPVIYLMVLNVDSAIPDRDNIRGVNMIIEPAKQLSLIRKAIPGIKDIGLLYNPSVTGNYIRNIKKVADDTGINIISKEVTNPKDAAARLYSMKGEIDAYLMVPDITVITPETVELLLLFSINNKVPVVTFSGKYLNLGAYMSIDINSYDIGKQAGEMVSSILSGRKTEEVSSTYARESIATINGKSAKKLGIAIDRRIINKAGITIQE